MPKSPQIKQNNVERHNSKKTYCWLPVAGKDLVRRILSDKSHEMRNLGKIVVMNKRIKIMP